MNLEKLNLVELDAQEVQETEGGFLCFLPWLVAGAVIVGVGAAAAHNGYVDASK